MRGQSSRLSAKGQPPLLSLDFDFAVVVFLVLEAFLEVALVMVRDVKMVGVEGKGV